MAPPQPRWLAWVVAVVILLLPLAGGAVLGWFGLNPMMEERLTPVGDFAHEFLNGFPDGRLVVEIAAPPGDLPAPSDISILWSRMNETLEKNSISFVEETYSPPAQGGSAGDLWSLELSTRHHWPVPGTMALFYLFVPGSYGPDPSVIGLAYFGSSIAVFPDTIAANAPGSEGVGLTATVMVHEFGHELGLVGIIGSAPNEDPAHPGHSNDPNDVMYWAVDTTEILGGLIGGSFPTQFDSADFSDLATVKNTAIPLEVIPWAVLALCVASAVILLVRHRSRQRPKPAAPPPPPPAEPRTGPKAICL